MFRDGYGKHHFLEASICVSNGDVLTGRCHFRGQGVSEMSVAVQAAVLSLILLVSRQGSKCGLQTRAAITR